MRVRGRSEFFLTSYTQCARSISMLRPFREGIHLERLTLRKPATSDPSIPSGNPTSCTLFLFFLSTIFYLFFSHTTQHNIQNKTKQNSRHILNISRFNQKGGREGRTTRTQKSLLYIITYIQQKNTAKPQWSKAWPHRLAPLYIHMRQFAGGCGSNMFFYTCVV